MQHKDMKELIFSCIENVHSTFDNTTCKQTNGVEQAWQGSKWFY